jgi:hypothetical protein
VPCIAFQQKTFEETMARLGVTVQLRRDLEGRRLADLLASNGQAQTIEYMEVGF